MTDNQDGCPETYDENHCVHWLDGDGPCCYCEAPQMSLEAMRAQNMDPPPLPHPSDRCGRSTHQHTGKQLKEIR